MYEISNKYWAVKIYTGSSITDPNIGLTDGVMYFTTGGYDGVGGIYEGGGGDVEQGVWNGDLLDRDNPLQSLSARVDLTDGGDFAYLSNATINLVNTTMVGGSFIKELIGIHGLSPVGYKVEVFVVVDGTFFSRWVGSVGDIKVTEKQFTFHLKDTNKDDEETVENECYGYVHRVPVAGGDSEVENPLPVISVPLARYDYTQGETTTVIHIPEFFSHIDGVLFGEKGDDVLLGVPSYRIWVAQNYDITSDLVFSVSKGTAETNLYDITNVVHTGDSYGNLMTIIHFAGILDIEDQIDLFGNYESIPAGSEYDNLYTFNGTLIKFYDKITTIKEGINTSKLIALYSSNGLELPLSSIIDGAYFKEQITISKNVDIAQSAVRWNVSNTPDIDGIRGDPDTIFPLTFNGEYDLTGHGLPYIQTLIDCSSALGDINLEDWDTVYLGVESRRMLIDANYNMLRSLNDFRFNHINTGTGRETEAVLTYERYNGAIEVETIDWYETSDIGLSIWNAFEIDVYPSYFDDKYGIVVIDDDTSLEITTPYGNDWTVNVVADELDTFDFAGLGSSNRADESDSDILHYEKSIPLFRDTVEARLFEAQYGSEANAIPDVSEHLSDSNYLLSVSSMTFDGDHRIMRLNQDNGQTSYYDFLTGDTVQSKVVVDYSLVGKTTILSGDGIWGSCRDNNTLTVQDLLDHLSGSGTVMIKIRRFDWEVGRIIDTQTSKGTMIADLCKQSFVLGFTNRFGSPEFTSYRDYADASYVVGIHSGDLIVKGTLGALETTPSSRIFNELEVQYEKDYVEGEYVNRIAIRKVTESAFPPSGGNWREFVIGVDDYDEASDLWNTAHEAYLDTNTINKVLEDVKELSFGVDARLTPESFGIRAMKEMVTWNTKPRSKVEYAIPITADTATLDLGDLIAFSDVILTDDATYLGWITKIDVDDKKFNLKIQLTFDPLQLQNIEGDWVVEDSNIDNWYGEDSFIDDWTEETGTL